MGLPDDVIARIEGSAGEQDFEVWPDNWEAVIAFLAVGTQWRGIGLMDGRVYWQGLDYAGVAAGLMGAGLAASPDLWRALRVMETAARNALNGILETD